MKAILDESERVVGFKINKFAYIIKSKLTGFMTQDNERRFFIDQNNQLDLTTMSWFDNLGTIYEILILYAFRGCSCISCS